MPVARIERIVGGIVRGRVERGSDGLFACHEFGSNVHPVALSTLEDVADYLRANPSSGVRMNPGCATSTSMASCFADLKRPTGRSQRAMVAGFDLRQSLRTAHAPGIRLQTTAEQRCCFDRSLMTDDTPCRGFIDAVNVINGGHLTACERIHAAPNQKSLPTLLELALDLFDPRGSTELV